MMAFAMQLKNETCELQKGLHVLLYMGISKARFNNDWLRLEMWQKGGGVVAFGYPLATRQK